MAIYWVRTAEMARGKQAEALEWARQITAYINDAYPETNGEVLTNIAARLDQIHFIAKHESLAVMEAFRAEVEANERYRALVKEMQEAGLFTAVSDRLYRVQ